MLESIILYGIISIQMLFLNRHAELDRLASLAADPGPRLAVLYGRRRVGKTRLLLEWTQRYPNALYTVADQSSADIQRQYFAASLTRVFPSFADVTYPSWAALFARLTSEAKATGWKGPLVIDELPYLALAAPEIASVLQRWFDHDAGNIKLALSGSSQRMMQGLVLSASAPLFGRAHELFEVRPLSPVELAKAFNIKDDPQQIVRLYTAWGGVPRYWELAQNTELTDVLKQVDRLVLDPLGPLHNEPDTLLMEELPPAIELRPLLDAIGLGAHRLSEIGGRLNRATTALSKPIARLQEMGLIQRETPFGEPEQGGKRSLYKLADPFVRLWFKVVAPARAILAAGSQRTRMGHLQQKWEGLVAATWEELCRTQTINFGFEPGKRWWHGNAPEWDVVCRSIDRSTVLVGEAKWSNKRFSASEIESLARMVAKKPLPPSLTSERVRRVLFVPRTAKTQVEVAGVEIVTGTTLLSEPV